MAEYIDKQAVLADLNETYDNMAGFHHQFYNGYQFAVNRIRTCPAADVEPVRRGRWVKCYDDGVATCSECGNTVSEEYCGRFCNYCGARMGGGAENAF